MTKGPANSGVIEKLTGPNAPYKSDIMIEGLPRAIANHGPNGLKFNPADGKLYMSIGGKNLIFEKEILKQFSFTHCE